MNKQIWKLHFKSIIDGEVEPIWVLLAKNKRPRKRGLGFSKVNTNQKDNLQENCTKFVDLLIGEIVDNPHRKESNTMDDLTLKFNDNAINKLISLVSQNSRYTDIILNKSANNSASDKEKALLNLGLVFLETSEWADIQTAQTFIEQGFPINFQHPQSGQTLLHRVVSVSGKSSSKFAEMLIETGQCDYLREDTQKQKPYDIAYKFNLDHNLADKLFDETEKQAKRLNVKASYLYGYNNTPLM